MHDSKEVNFRSQTWREFQSDILFCTFSFRCSSMADLQFRELDKPRWRIMMDHFEWIVRTMLRVVV